MNSIARTLAATAVGVTLAAGVLTACATPHTEQGFVSEMRAGMSDTENAAVSDQQMIAAGRMLCSFPGALEAARTEHSDRIATVETYCDVLRTEIPAADPMAWVPEAGATAAEPMPPAEVPVTTGTPFSVNYGGTENALDVTITGVSRCSSYLILDVRLVTGSIYSENDSWVSGSGIEWLDSSGVTRQASDAFVGDQCFGYDEQLPYAYDRKPGRTYVGKLAFEIPSTATQLMFDGTDGVTRTLAISGT